MYIESTCPSQLQIFVYYYTKKLDLINNSKFLTRNTNIHIGSWLSTKVDLLWKNLLMSFNSSPVTEIINTSLQQWKQANVIPLPKTTPPYVGKLRPVSLTSSVAKIAEERVSKFGVDSIQSQYGNQKGNVHHPLPD